MLVEYRISVSEREKGGGVGKKEEKEKRTISDCSSDKNVRREKRK